ncbi:DUF58 domain-containing protein [Chlamydiota bacterium]
MISKEILKNVRHIEIRTKQLVNDVFSGEYKSVFKGRGMEFSEVREYQPGDDIRSVDWNVTARMGHPFVKKYVEERQLNVMLMVDVSGSQLFGTSKTFKSEFAAEVSSVLAFAAIKNNDRVGVILFTDEIELYIPPQKGRQHVLRVIREILYFKARRKKTNIANALQFLNRITKRRSVVFLLSDFVDQRFKKDLQITSKKHDVVSLYLYDRKEIELPQHQLFSLEDPETGEQLIIDTASSGMISEFEKEQRHTQEMLIKEFQANKVDCILLENGKSYVEPLIAFFKMREKRFR